MKCNRCQGGAPGYVCAGCIGKVAAKTNAERQAARTARLEAAGLKQLRNLWAHPEDEAEIREAAARAGRRRERAMMLLGLQATTRGDK